MSDTTTTEVSNRIAEAPGEITSTVGHGLHRAWRAGLGLFAAAGEQVQSAFQTLEGKGERLEPAVAAPFRRVGATATRVIGRAGTPVKTVGSAVGSAVGTLGTTVARVGGGATVSAADIKDEMERLFDERLSALQVRLDALERRALPSREDFDALAERVEELATKGKKSH